MLNILFDYQRFADNSRLAAMIGDVLDQSAELSDDALETVSAAGELASDDGNDDSNN